MPIFKVLIGVLGFWGFGVLGCFANFCNCLEERRISGVYRPTALKISHKRSGKSGPFPTAFFRGSRHQSANVLQHLG